MSDFLLSVNDVIEKLKVNPFLFNIYKDDISRILGSATNEEIELFNKFNREFFKNPIGG